MKRRQFFKRRSPLPPGADMVEFAKFSNPQVVSHLRIAVALMLEAGDEVRKALPLTQYGYEKFTINSILAHMRDARLKLEKHANKNA